MFRRWEEAKEISRQEAAEAIRAEGRTEGRAEGITVGMARGVAQGKTEGIAQGRAEAHRVWYAWYQRQAEAQEKGHPFTEPPPTLNGDTPDE